MQIYKKEMRLSPNLRWDNVKVFFFFMPLGAQWQCGLSADGDRHLCGYGGSVTF